MKIPILQRIHSTADGVNRLQSEIDALIRRIYALAPMLSAQVIDVTLDAKGTFASTPVPHGLGRKAKWTVGNTSAPTMLANDASNPVPDQQLLLTSAARGPITCTLVVF